jgi:putative transposase
MRFRSKKSARDSIYVRKRNFNFTGPKSFTVFPRNLKIGKVRTYEVIFKKGITESNIRDSKIMKDIYGDYYLYLAYDMKLKEMKYNENKNCVCSCDPGIRTFQTTYDPEGNVHHFCDDMSKIDNICRDIDDIRSSISKEKNRNKKKRLRHRMLLREKRVKNMIRDMHYKIANYICSNYNICLIPTFTSNSPTIRKSLSKKSNRFLGILSHYSFRQRLKWVGRKRGTYVKEVTEEYTSKTCTNCGTLNENLGSKKKFNCDKCGLSIDRDVNGARNVFMKELKCIVVSL